MKYALITILSGVLISGMVAINGELTAIVGNAPATVVIHVMGLVALVAAFGLRRMHPHPGQRMPWHLYIGGVIGVGSVLMNNYTYPILGVSITLGLGLLGQLVFSLMIDRFGLFGMPKLSLRPHRIISALIVLAGIAVMMLGGN